MRNYILSILLLTLLHISVYGQVFTCKGGTVDAFTRAEMSSSQISSTNNSFNSQYGYLGITFLGNSSLTYNCHSYAWHLREGNSNRVWINNAIENPGSCWGETNNIDQYWEDGCFIQVCNSSQADKVHYYCGDHSATASATHAGYFESKWGAGPVYRHTLTGIPYMNPSQARYFASTKISGSTANLCGNRVFTVKNISGANYVWTTSPGVTIQSGQFTNSITVQSISFSTQSAWAEVQISTPCSSTPATNRINFTTGPQAIMPNFISNGYWQSYPDNPTNLYGNVCVGSYYGYTVQLNFPGVTNLRAYLYSSGSYPTVSGNVVYWNYTPGAYSGTLRIEYDTPCGHIVQVITLYNTCYGYRYTVSPNPARNTVTLLAPKEERKGSSERTPKSSTILVTVVDQFNTVRLRKQMTRNNSYQIDISNLTYGVYMLQIVDGQHSFTEKLVVEK